MFIFFVLYCLFVYLIVYNFPWHICFIESLIVGGFKTFIYNPISWSVDFITKPGECEGWICWFLNLPFDLLIGKP